MDEHLHNIDKLFRSAVNDYEETPPPEVWDGLDKQLDKTNIVSIKKKYAYLKRALVAVMLLCCVVSLFALLVWHPGTKPLPAPPAASNQKTGRQPATGITATSPASRHAAMQQKDSAAATAIEQKNIATAPATTKSTPEQSVATIPGVAGASSSAAVPAPRSIQKIPDTKAMQNDVASYTVNRVARKPGGKKTKLPVYSNKAGYDVTGPEHAAVSGTDASTPERSLTPISTLPPMAQVAVLPQPNRALSAVQSGPGIAFSPAVNSHAQTIRLTPLRTPFSIAIFASPDIAFNRLEADRPKNREEDKDAIQKGEQNKISFMAGITADINIGHNFLLQTGLAFSNTVKTIEAKNIYARPDNHGDIQYRYNCSSGYYFIAPKPGSRPLSNGDSLSLAGATNTLQYISIPLAVKYKLVEGKFSIQPVLGAAANILTKEKIETAIVTGSTAEKQVQNGINGLKPVYFSGLLSIEADWQFSKLFGVRLAPTGRFALTSMSKEAAVKTYPAYLGIAAGITLKL